MVEQAAVGNRPRRSKRAVVLQVVAAVVSFASGIAVGAGGIALLVRHRVIWIHRHRRTQAEIAQQMKKRYGLTDEQTKKVEEVLAETMENKSAIRQEMEAKYDAERAKLVEAMKQILTEDQFNRWHAELQARVERYKRMRSRRTEKER